MSDLLILDSGFYKDSKTHTLAQEVYSHLTDANCSLLTLGDYDLPICEGRTFFSDPKVESLTELIQPAKGVLIATPIYNYSINSLLKNVIECTGSAWKEMVVGFLVAAGGPSSYMAVMGTANSLMLDFRCLIIPRFVYAQSQDFEGSILTSQDVRDRIKGLAEQFLHLTSVV